MKKKDSKYWEWALNQTLYLYYNDEKLILLLSEIYDSIQSEFQKSQTKSASFNMKLAAKTGALLSWLGIGEASGEVGGEIDKSKTSTFIGKVSNYHLLNGLIDFKKNNDCFPCYDVYNGLEIYEGKDDKYRGSGPIANSKHIYATFSGVAKIGGLFKVRRINPKAKKKTNLVRDLLDGKPNLWVLETSSDSRIKCEIPFLTSNFRHTSQGAMVMLNEVEDKKIGIQAVGLLSCSENVIKCDPLAWGVLRDTNIDF